MFQRKTKNDLELLKAFKKLFFNSENELKEEAKRVIVFLRDEAGGRGELGVNGVPYLYDKQNRFDAHAAAFLLGKRRIFDLIVKYLALDEREVFGLCYQEQKKVEKVLRELDV